MIDDLWKDRLSKYNINMVTYSESRVRAPFHESNIRLYKTKIMTKNNTSYNLKYG